MIVLKREWKFEVLVYIINVVSMNEMKENIFNYITNNFAFNLATSGFVVGASVANVAFNTSVEDAPPASGLGARNCQPPNAQLTIRADCGQGHTMSARCSADGLTGR